MLWASPLRDGVDRLGWGLEMRGTEELADESAPSETEKEIPQYYYVSQGHVLLESRNCVLGYRG